MIQPVSDNQKEQIITLRDRVGHVMVRSSTEGSNEKLMLKLLFSVSMAELNSKKPEDSVVQVVIDQNSDTGSTGEMKVAKPGTVD